MCTDDILEEDYSDRENDLISETCDLIDRLVNVSSDHYAWDCPAMLANVVEFDAAVSRIRDLSERRWPGADEDHVPTVYNTVTKSKTVSICDYNAAGSIGHGGFGQVFSAKVACAPSAGKRKGFLSSLCQISDNHVTFDVAVKLVIPDPRDPSTDALNEIAISRGIYGGRSPLDVSAGSPSGLRPPLSRVLPVMHVDINPRTSHARLVFPLGASDLSRALRFAGRHLSPHTKKRWCAELVSAVAEIHAHGVVHGDIKPKNIIVFPAKHATASRLREAIRAIMALRAKATTAFGRVVSSRAVAAALDFTTLYVADFGLATFATSETRGVVATNTSYPYTAEYRPLEVWNNHRWSYSADIWALGCTIFELTFGKPLFAEKHVPTPGRGDYAAHHARRQAYVAAQEDFAKQYDLFSENNFYLNNLPLSSYGTVKCAMSPEEWGDCEPYELRNFIASMLQLSPNSRLYAIDLLEHPYVADETASKARLASSPRIPSLEAIPIWKQALESELTVIEAPAWITSVHTLCAYDYYISGAVPQREMLRVACARVAPTDHLVRGLGEWLLSREIELHHKSRSIRIRKFDIYSLAAACCSIAAKVLSRQATISTLSSVSARDERAICEQLGFNLFPFKYETR